MTLTRTPILIALLLIAAAPLHATPDTLSGVVNNYARVVWIDCDFNATLLIEGPEIPKFNAGDRILIIQMKGAEVATPTDTADSTFGHVTNYHSAGNYELAVIEKATYIKNGIVRKQLTLKKRLVRSYDVTGMVQVVRIPKADTVVVTGLITPKPWNAYLGTGGVVALEADSLIRLDTNIDASGMGFVCERGDVHLVGYQCGHLIYVSLLSTGTDENGSVVEASIVIS